MKKTVSVIALAVMNLVTVSAHAMASGSVVFDPMNYAKNLLTALQTADQVQKTVDGNLQRLQHLQEAYRQGKAIASGDLNAMASAAGVSQLGQQIRDMQNMRNSLSNLTGDIGDLRNRYNYSMQMAQRYGLTLEQYQANQAKQVANNVEAARIEQSKNMLAMEHVSNSYKQVQVYQERLPDNDTALLQSLNKQMALLNTTNAKLLEYMVQSNQSKQLEVVDVNGKAQSEAESKKKYIEQTKRSDDELRQKINSEYAPYPLMSK